MGKRTDGRLCLEDLHDRVLGHVSDAADHVHSDKPLCAEQLQALALVEILEVLRFVATAKAHEMPYWILHREAKKRGMLTSNHELPQPTGD